LAKSQPVSQDELRSLFEAARWAPSSYNEQPWRYVVATRNGRAQFERLLSCLVEGNQAWAKRVPVLALGIVSLKFAKNGKDNRAAVHDLGLVAGKLVVEATARGLRVHQMIGILPDKAREVFGIPAGYAAWTGIAIGYEGDPATLPDNLKQRDLTSANPSRSSCSPANGGIRHPSWRNARITRRGRQLPGHPYCGETVELFLESDVEGSLVQDCEVCCNPWHVEVWTEGGHRRVSVRRADGSE
jgi:nitroreductase